jgi:hypothetical protein
MIRLVLRIGAASLALALALAAPAARADGLDAAESARLARGETVVRTQTIERGDHRWVGGVTYTVLETTPREMDAILDDVASWKRILPRTKSAVRVGTIGGDALIELRQGSSVFETSYTIRVHKDVAARTVRFWLDPSRAHGIDDAWGFFRIEPMGAADPSHALLTFGVLVDMGDGIARTLFEERIRAATLAVPQRVREHLATVHARRPERVTMR